MAAGTFIARWLTSALHIMHASCVVAHSGVSHRVSQDTLQDEKILMKQPQD